MNQDQEHLRLLAIFHYLLGGLMALFGSIPLVYVGVGIALISGLFPEPPNQPPPPMPESLVGGLFVAMGATFVLIGWTLAAMVAYTGRCLQQYRHYTFCLVIAGLECMCVPLGTVLGVFTIVVLVRPSVKELFEQGGGVGQTGAANQPSRG
jgi:hypothetical protein